jgi:hypothetical protein
MKYFIQLIYLFLLTAALLSGCASQQKPQPLAYLSLETPKGIIGSKEIKETNKEFSKGGLYLVNLNFRPAPDLSLYIDETSKEAGTNILKNADIMLKVPFAFDILLFGINVGTDIVTTTKLGS